MNSTKVLEAAQLFQRMLLAGILLFISSGCQLKEIDQPIPFTYVFDFDMAADGSTSFNDSASVSAQEISSALQDQLDGELSLESISESYVEGLSYTLLDVDQTHAIVNSDFTLFYGGNTPVSLLSLEDVIIGEILNEPQPVAMPPEGVDLLQTAIDNILSGNASGELLVTGQGSISHLVRRFTLRVEITVTHVVQQEIEVFDPF